VGQTNAAPEPTEGHGVLGATRRQRFVGRFLPASERAAAVWIAGVSAAYLFLKALVYQPFLLVVTLFVPSPRFIELGFPLRATAAADAIWLVAVAVLAWALFRFTAAPKAVALFVIGMSLLTSLVSLGNRAALDIVAVLVGTEYQPTIWSTMQPLMLSLAESAGIVIGAWTAYLGDPARDRTVRATLAPALDLAERPLPIATRLALSYVVVLVLTRLAVVLVEFVPSALSAVVTAQGRGMPGDLANAQLGFVLLMAVILPALAAWWAVSHQGAPVTVWLAFLASATGGLVANARALVVSLPVFAGGADITLMLSVIGSVLAAFSPLGGVWLATRDTRGREPSATLPGEGEDREDAGGFDG
jgi:hypothetical protein